MDTALRPSPSVFDDEPPPLDESDWLALPPLEARGVAAGLPLDTRFELRDFLTPVQYAFLQEHGFLLFARVASPDEVAAILDEIDRVQARLLDEGIDHIYGVPVWFGEGPDGEPWLQRMGFSSVYSRYIEDFVQSERFEPIRRLIGEDARIGLREKDGVVFNRYIRTEGSLRPGLAWHTDALRDVFYNGQMPGPMLNVGLHFDRIRPRDGGLRLLPGTHTQSAWSTLFRKVHFVTDDEDPDEIAVETWPGDLTVHDGRMWHRVAASPHTGTRSIRRSMYVPYVIDAYQPKSEDTGTLGYMKVFDVAMRARKRLGRLRDRVRERLPGRR